MKKNTRNIIVFILVCIFVLSGMLNKTFIKSMALDAYALVKTERSIDGFISKVNKDSSEKTLYHKYLMDFNSLVMRQTGKQVVQKGSDIVIRLDNEYLYDVWNKADNKTIKDSVNNVKKLSDISKKNGANFLYVMAPCKGLEQNYPMKFDNFSKDNCNNLLSELKGEKIPVLDLVRSMNDEFIKECDMFFATDHHWKPESGFWAFGKIYNELNSLYGFKYDEKITNIDNYNIKVYNDWFVGSQGKKTGRYFTKFGAEDIDIITPKFETSLIEERPNVNESKSGDFLSSVMFMENIEEKDYYNLHPYAAYSGGDFRLQIITNKLNKGGKKVVYIGDSFSHVCVPFLSLGFSEIHKIDVRNYEWYVGEKINVQEYIEKVKPDYVIVMYTGIMADPVGRYDFF